MRCSSSTLTTSNDASWMITVGPRGRAAEPAQRLLDLRVGEADRAAQPLQHRAQRVLLLRQHRHRVADHVVGDDLAVAVVDDAARRRQRQLAQSVRLGLERVLLVLQHLRCGRTRRQEERAPRRPSRSRRARAAGCRSGGSSCARGSPARDGAASARSRRPPPSPPPTSDDQTRICITSSAPDSAAIRRGSSGSRTPTSRGRGRSRSAARCRRRTPP